MYKFIIPVDISDSDNIQRLHELPKGEKYLLFFDQANNTSGISIFNEEGLLRGFGYLKREDKETIPQYRVHLRRFIEDFVMDYNIVSVCYEDVYGGEFNSTKLLHQLQTIFEDAKVMSGKDFIVRCEGNKRWKKRLFYPEKITVLGSKYEKKQIQESVIGYYPFIKNVFGLVEDTFDAIGIGIAHFRGVKGELPEKLTKEKPKINKRDKVIVEVAMVSDKSEVVIRNTKLRKYANMRGVQYVKYDKAYSLEDNIKIACLGTKKLIYFVIPEHSKIGEICLRHGCPYQEDKILIAHGTLSKRAK